MKILIIGFFLATACFSQTFIELGRFGGKGDKPGQFNNPQSIAVSSDGIVYVVDTDNHRIQLFRYNGEFIKSIGGFGFKEDQFDLPKDIWVNSLINIYVSDFNNRRVQRFDKDMNFLSSFSNNEGEDPDFQFGEIASCILSTQNDLFILDHEEYKIVKYNRDGRSERIFGNFESGSGELNYPEQMELWSADKILVSDPGKKAIIVFDLFGNYLRSFQSDEFKYPRGLEVDQKNRIYVADPEAKKIFFKSEKSDAFSEIKFITGFKFPRDVATYRKNEQLNIYVLDGNQVISGKITFENVNINK